MLSPKQHQGNDGQEPLSCEFVSRLWRAAKLASLIPDGPDSDAPLGRGLPLSRGLIYWLASDHGIPAKSLPGTLADVELLGLAVVLCDQHARPTLYSCAAEGGVN